jgi:hypothetical protein
VDAWSQAGGLVAATFGRVEDDPIVFSSDYGKQLQAARARLRQRLGEDFVRGLKGFSSRVPLVVAAHDAKADRARRSLSFQSAGRSVKVCVADRRRSPPWHHSSEAT